MFPNLFCPGTVKSGTSTLYEILYQHPDVFFPYKKEIHYFSKCRQKGDAWYKKLYKGSNGEKYLCDFTPNYFALDDFPKDVLELSGPNAKFIFMLRNPADRFYSHYWMLKNFMHEPEESIEEMVSDAEQGCPDSKHDLLNLGFYYKHITNMLKYYPIENMHFVFFDDFISDKEGSCKRLYKFLGISGDININYDIWANQAKTLKNFAGLKLFKKLVALVPVFVKERIPAKLKAKTVNCLKSKLLRGEVVKIPKDSRICKRLIGIYKDDIINLGNLLNVDLSHWIEEYEVDE